MNGVPWILQKADVDEAIDDLIKDPTVGEKKKGDVGDVFVYKFKCNGQLTLLAYESDAASGLLLLLVHTKTFTAPLNADP
ncbi:MAG: type II toxin-antitoxin system RelE/ParE family toxin [Chlorobiaceae bacterium]